MELIIKGEPVALQRARSSRGHFYLPEKSRVYLDLIGFIAKTKFKEPLEGNIQLEMTFYCGHNRADLDNYIKAVGDGLQGIAFKNDKQIQKITAEKIIDKKNSQTIIKIWNF